MILKVPKTVWSQLGPVPVVLRTPVHSDDDATRSAKIMGKYEHHNRRIVVDSAMHELTTLQIAYHEAVHCWLLDAGIQLGKLEEVTVNTIATAIVNLLQEQPRTRRR